MLYTPINLRWIVETRHSTIQQLCRRMSCTTVAQQPQKSEQIPMRVVHKGDVMTLALPLHDGIVRHMERPSHEELGVSLKRMYLTAAKHFEKNQGKASKKKNKNKSGAGSKQQSLSEDWRAELIDPNGCKVPHATTNESAWTEGSTLTLNDRSLVVMRNPPTILSIRLPGLAVEGVLVVPIVETLYIAQLEHCAWAWFRKATGATNGDSESDGWVRVSEGEMTYVPTAADVGATLLVTCTPMAGERVGEPIDKEMQQAVVERPPYSVSQRVWKRVADDCVADYQEQDASARQTTLRLVTYNILSDNYGKDEDMYYYCDAVTLHRDYRKQIIAEEIRALSPDLIALQEVDEFNFPEFATVLERPSPGLTGEFARKYGRASEGCALFWKRDRFDVLESKAIRLGGNLLSEAHHSELRCFLEAYCPETLRRFEGVGGVAQLFVLREKWTGKVMCVTNSHFYWHPDANDVRLTQGLALLGEIKHFLASTSRDVEDTGVVVMGDLNSVPHVACIELLKTGQVSRAHRDWSSHSPQLDEVSIDPDDTHMACPFPLKSAAPDFPYTNFVPRFKWTLDWIFVTENHLRPVRYLDIPEDAKLMYQTALPSRSFPSDHIPVAVELELMNSAY